MAQRPPKKRPTPQLVSLSKETLDQILPELKGVGTELRIQGRALDGIYSTLSSMAAETAERAKDAARDAKLEAGKDRTLFQKLFGLGKPQKPKEDTTIRGGVSRGIEKGIGGGLGVFMKLIGGGVGLAALGAGIAGFLSAMSGADAAARKLGTGEHLVELLGNVAAGLSKFNVTNGAALAGILGVGALFGAVAGVSRSGKAAIGMGAIGLGIGSFVAGFMAPLAGLNWLGLNLDKMPQLATAVGDTLTAFAGSFDQKTAMALAGILGATALFSVRKGLRGVAGIGRVAIGLTALGAGLGGFVAGIAGTSGLAAFLGFDGEGFAEIATNIGKGFSAFSDSGLAGLGALFGAGALFGVAGPKGLVAAGFASIGATIMGFGLGGFLAGMATAGGLAGWFGVTGEGLRTIMINTAEGMQAFDGVDGKNFSELGIGMAGLGTGLAAFLISLGANKVANGITNLANFLTAKIKGEEYIGDKGKTIADRLMDTLNPLKDIDPTVMDNVNTLNGTKFKQVMTDVAAGLGEFTKYELGAAFSGLGTAILNFFSGKDQNTTIFDQIKAVGDDAAKLEKGATALERVAKALGSFSSLKFNANDFNIKKLAQNLGMSIPLLEGLTKGGKVGEGLFDGPEIDFGKGLINNPNINLPGLGDALEELNRVLAGGQAVRQRSAVNRQMDRAISKGEGGTAGMIVKSGDYITGGATYVTNNYVTNNYAAKVPANSSLTLDGHAK